MAIVKNCQNCDYFKTISGAPNQGECHRFAPAGMDSHVVATQGDNTRVFASIYDSTDEWCGDFKFRQTN